MARTVRGRPGGCGRPASRWPLMLRMINRSPRLSFTAAKVGREQVARPKVYPTEKAYFFVTPETLVCSLKPRLFSGTFK